jgi:pyruvate formate lyase activating enzyme
MKGNVFNIQRFSIGDGPGIRTTVFLKGCNLNCAWCHNPEALCHKPELQFISQRCILCGKCVSICPNGVHSMEKGERKIDRSLCQNCGVCVEGCVSGALSIIGKLMDTEVVVEAVLRDMEYFRNSNGGMTISGGEPMLQKEFIKEILQKTKALGIHNAVDTAANVEWQDFEDILPWVDLVLLDIKIFDALQHKAYTGATNERIFDNAGRLSREAVDIIVRIPVIAGVNDTEENMKSTALMLKSFKRLKYVELLPYHNLGVEKLSRLGREGVVQSFESPSREKLLKLAECFKAEGLKTQLE